MPEGTVLCRDPESSVPTAAAAPGGARLTGAGWTEPAESAGGGLCGAGAKLLAGAEGGEGRGAEAAHGGRVLRPLLRRAGRAREPRDAGGAGAAAARVAAPSARRAAAGRGRGESGVTRACPRWAARRR